VSSGIGDLGAGKGWAGEREPEGSKAQGPELKG